MALVYEMPERAKTTNFAVQGDKKCLNCSRAFSPGKDLYARRFCSADCMTEYLV